MNTPSPDMLDLARRLVAAHQSIPSPETAGGSNGPPLSVAVCATLRKIVVRFAGPDGFASLLRRALALARADVPALQSVRLGRDCELEGVEQVDGEGTEAAVALAAHLLTLLVTFIGEPLTVRLVREDWPGEKLDQ